MSYRVSIRPEAEADLLQTYRWYEQQRKGLGEYFLLCVEAGLQTIGDNPLAGSVVFKQIRRTLIRRFPHAIFYVFDKEAVSVLAVLHCRRDPEIWKHRT